MPTDLRIACTGCTTALNHAQYAARLPIRTYAPFVVIPDETVPVFVLWSSRRMSIR